MDVDGEVDHGKHVSSKYTSEDCRAGLDSISLASEGHDSKNGRLVACDNLVGSLRSPRRCGGAVEHVHRMQHSEVPVADRRRGSNERGAG
eukprot:2690744-Pleurochrysis_carterae.AAC.3